MRGSGEQAEQQISLEPGAALKVEAADHPDAAALSGVLHGQPDQRWTGIRVRDDEPAAHLDLWPLATMTAQGHGEGASFSACCRSPRTPAAAGSPTRPCAGREPGCTTAAPLPGSPPGRPTTAPGNAESTPRARCSRARRDRAHLPRRMGRQPPRRSGHHRHPRARRTRNCIRACGSGQLLAHTFALSPGSLRGRAPSGGNRPACPAARLAGEIADNADAPLRAAGACNLTALIASDCAMPDLARALCWTQFDALPGGATRALRREHHEADPPAAGEWLDPARRRLRLS